MKRLTACNQSEHVVSRRSILAGTIGALGAGVLGQPLLSEELHARRKRLLILFQSGGASQFETWDPKPGTKTGGPFRAISTSLPGVHIGELLPHTAGIMHRLAVVRSVNTRIADHFLGHYALQSGRRVPGYPVLGSAAARLLEQPGDVLPGYVSLRRDGPKAFTDIGDAGFLGPKYEAVKIINGQPPANLVRPAAISESTESARDAIRRRSDERFLSGRSARSIQAYGNSFDQAAVLMKRRDIFDLNKEPAADRERYGDHDFGRHCLLARRLLESGINCVKVVHHDWDAHEENFHWHQQRCSEFDGTFATLINDFADRGLLEDTLIVVTGEMGRTPRINNRAGRDHWGNAWSMAMAGCGIEQGVVYGKTNEDGTSVVDGEVDLGHLFHTWLTALGLDPTGHYDIGGGENQIGTPAASAIKELLA
jgi:hypothetical protein